MKPMPWRLIEFIIIFAVFVVFIALNLGNKCDISFGFRSLKEVPVFLTAFSSFALGMICAMPFIISARVKRKNRAGKKANSPKSGTVNDRETSADVDNTFSDGGPYGVN
jgi:uncharacterized integral membrane protein